MNRRILIIDDNPAVHADFRKILTVPPRTVALDEDEALLFGDEAHAAVPSALSELLLDSAYQGQEGLEMVVGARDRGQPYAMAFIDMRMPPGWDGLETISRIWDAVPNIEIVICTAFSDYSWEETITRVGRVDRLLILKKPFDTIEIQQLALALTEKWNLRRDAQLKLSTVNRLVEERTAELAEAHQELLDAVDELKVANAVAIKANRSKCEFLANMSHEIRTPMNGVIGFTDLLLCSSLNGEQHDLAKSIKTSGQTLLSLINDILDFSKIEAGELAFDLRPANLRRLVREAGQVLLPQALAKGITLTIEVDETIPCGLLLDPTRLRQVLLNIAGNAVKFTSEGSVVIHARTLKTHQRSVTVAFEIKDTGIGIPQDAIETIFSRFSQADASTTRRFGGTGLGLSICESLVEMMGGRIRVESELGLGSTFSFEIAFDIAECNELAFRAEPEAGPLRFNARVLYVEDNRVNQIVTAKLLEKLGCECTLASTGQEALDSFDHRTFDMVLMDCHMPGLDGYQTTRAMREREGDGPRIPIVAYTASVLKQDHERANAAGMDALLAKPMTLDALHIALCRCLALKTDAEQP